MVRSVLLVDDDHTTTNHYARALRLEGYQVVTAESGPDGLQKALLTPPDLALLDLRMPVMDGITLLEHFRATVALRDVPVVIVTGDYFLDDSKLAQLHTLGATIQFKPLWVDDLLALIATLSREDPASRLPPPANPS